MEETKQTIKLSSEQLKYLTRGVYFLIITSAVFNYGEEIETYITILDKLMDFRSFPTKEK